MRITKKVFYDLAIWMVAFGLSIGIVFPFFVIFLGVPSGIVLKSICAVARSALREGDILFRYGGEEFVAVLPAASTEDLRNIAERLRMGIEAHVLSDGPEKVRVTVSIGGAAYPSQNVESEENLIQFADEALYRAKHSGRNRVALVQ